ncbi:MAG: helix-turn-helix domain-containing protein, partial [Chloroflexi bacterium]|nr:helix-turn-helix domain-containing protein [Chloroflexota bacterium]
RTDCAAVAPLTRSQAELLGLLLQDGRPLVPHAELESKTVAYQATADRADALRKRVYRLNQRLAPLAVQVRAKRGQGYRLVWH